MYIDSVMNYTGSKFKLLNQILPEFDFTKKNFVDVFCGGGSVYANVVDKYEKIIINDIIAELIGIHKGIIENDLIINDTKKLCETLKESQEDFLKLRENYNNNPTPAGLWALILSCNSNLMRFNQKGKFNQTWGKRSFNISTEKKVKLFKEHIRNYSDKIYFKSGSFSDIEIESDTFYYLDPPYAFIKNDDGEIGNKQISEAGYNSYYYKEDDINLRNFCHKINDIGSTFVISGVLEHGGKTTWILDKLIKDGFSVKEINFNYEGVNKTNQSKNTKEVIIKNF
jgi:DNA adenine methylase Dam